MKTSSKPQPTGLSDDELCVKVAELCPSIAHVIYLLGFKPEVFWKGRTRNVEFRPLHDLNAMHEAEKILTPHQCWDYRYNLKEIVQMGGDCAANAYHFHATARQRAEAFVKTLTSGGTGERSSSGIVETLEEPKL